MIIRITEPKQVLKGHSWLRKTDNLTPSLDPWWSKTSSTNLQIYPVYVKEDTIARLKCDIRIGRADYNSWLESSGSHLFENTALTAIRDSLIRQYRYLRETASEEGRRVRKVCGDGITETCLGANTAWIILAAGRDKELKVGMRLIFPSTDLRQEEKRPWGT
jgi:hypothetical protein